MRSSSRAALLTLVITGCPLAYGLDLNIPPGGHYSPPSLFSDENSSINPNLGLSVLRGLQGDSSVVGVDPIGLEPSLLAGTWITPELTLNLPDGTTTQATLKSAYALDQKSSVWSGDIHQADQITGAAMFVVSKKRVTGKFNIGQRTYELLTANEGGRYFLVERDYSKLPGDERDIGAVDAPDLFAPEKPRAGRTAARVGKSVLRALQREASVTSTTPVDVKPLLLAIGSPALDVNLPNQEPLRAILKESYALDSDSTVWSGTLQAPDSSPGGLSGEAVFVVTGDRVTGKIVANGKTTEIVTANEGGRYFLVERDLTQLPEADDTPANSGNLGDLAVPSSTPKAAITKIRVLQGATPTAVTQLGGKSSAEDRLRFFLAEANTVYTNNNLPIQLVNAGLKFPSAKQPTSDGPTLVNKLKSSTDGYLDGLVTTTRDATTADLVGLITDNTLTSVFGGLCGIAHTVGAQAPQAVFVVNQSCTNYTFVHEIGHLFGARHDNDPSTKPYLITHKPQQV